MIRFTCLLLSALLSCSVLGDEGSEATHLAPRIAACNVGRLYCYHEIVNDLRKSDANVFPISCPISSPLYSSQLHHGLTIHRIPVTGSEQSVLHSDQRYEIVLGMFHLGV